MQGLNLSAPHGELIWQGKKSVIVKPRQFPEILGHHILISDSFAWGEIEVGKEQCLSAAEFDEHFSEHRVTKKERKKWWPAVDTLYLYPVVSFAPYDRPRPVDVPNGAKTIIEEVQFKEDDMPYSMQNLPRPAKNWPRTAQKKCIATANAVLRDGGSDQDAIFACIHAAGMTQHPGREDNKEVAFSETDYAIAEGIVSTLQEVNVNQLGDMIAQGIVTAMTNTIKAEQNIPEPESKGTEPESDKATDLDNRIASIRDAFYNQFNPPKMPNAVDSMGATLYVKQVWDDAVIIERLGKFYRVPYKIAKNGNVEFAIADEWQEVEETWSEKESSDQKIGKRFSASVMKIFQDLKNAIDGLIRRGNYEDEEDEDEDKKGKAIAFKTVDHNGKTYLVIWPTNAFQDRELEIFSTKAITDYVERHKSDAIKGEVRYRHWPNTKFGDIVWQGMTGRFLVEVATFDDTPVGQAFKNVLITYPAGHPAVCPEGWGTSHGYKYREEDREDGIYEWFDKWETSVLPGRLAANPHNPSVEVITMDEKDREELSALVGEEVAKQVAELGDRLTKEKEEAGVAHKEADIYEEDTEMAVKERWDTAYVNDLPDSAFLYITPGGKKDEEGKTVPRNLRKLPYKDMGGDIDLPHLRNAISRLGQPKTDIPEDVKKRLQKKAQRLLAEHGGEEKEVPEASTAPESEEKVSETTEIVSAVAKELHLDELATAFKALTDTNASLVKELENVKKRLAEVEREDIERIAEKEASLPAWPWSHAFRPSQADSTKIGGNDAIKAKLPKNVPPAIAGIVAGMGGE